MSQSSVLSTNGTAIESPQRLSNIREPSYEIAKEKHMPSPERQDSQDKVEKESALTTARERVMSPGKNSEASHNDRPHEEEDDYDDEEADEDGAEERNDEDTVTTSTSNESGTKRAKEEHDDDESHENMLNGGTNHSSSKRSKGLNARWEEMFNRLLQYREAHGDCLVPNRYQDDPQLGSWVSTQRRHYKLLKSGSGESTPMTVERAKRLEEVGFQWATKDPRHVPWEQRYAELVEFKNQYGHSQVPIGWPDNIQLSNWVSTQRQEYKLIRRGRQSRLTRERIQLLNKIDFVWEAQRGGPRRKKKGLVAVPDKARVKPITIGPTKKENHHPRSTRSDGTSSGEDEPDNRETRPAVPASSSRGGMHTSSSMPRKASPRANGERSWDPSRLLGHPATVADVSGAARAAATLAGPQPVLVSSGDFRLAHGAGLTLNAQAFPSGWQVLPNGAFQQAINPLLLSGSQQQHGIFPIAPSPVPVAALAYQLGPVIPMMVPAAVAPQILQHQLMAGLARDQLLRDHQQAMQQAAVANASILSRHAAVGVPQVLRGSIPSITRSQQLPRNGTRLVDESEGDNSSSDGDRD